MREPLLLPGGDTVDRFSPPPKPRLPPPRGFPITQPNKVRGNKCALPPRVTGRSRLKIQFEAAGFERRVRVSWCRAAAAAAAAPHRRGGGGGGGARRFRRRGRLFSVASVAHTPLCDCENRRAAHSGVSQEVFLTHRRANGGGPGDLLRSTIPSVNTVEASVVIYSDI